MLFEDKSIPMDIDPKLTIHRFYICLLVALYLLRKGNRTRKKGRGDLQAGRKSVTLGQKRISDGRRTILWGCVFFLLALFPSLLTVVFGAIMLTQCSQSQP